jgi:hypothetical protein
MIPPSDFDAFLSHNSNDKPGARELKRLLQARGLSVWFDEDELRPGLAWQPLLEKGLESAGSVIVAMGASGLGPWQDEETQSALDLARTFERPVIPVLLPGCPAVPGAGSFLRNRTWVDLRGGYSDDGVSRLVWGITGEKPSIIESAGVPNITSATKWILVAGSGGITPRPQIIDNVCVRLGTELAANGFSLVTGGWNGVDYDVARAFAVHIQESGQSLSGRLVQVMQEGATPEFPSGRLVSGGSDDQAWRHSIERADAVVLVGGLGGTHQTGEWALDAGKPVFPLADTRGPLRSHSDAYNFYFATLREWSRNPASRRITAEQFQDLANPAPGVVVDLIRVLKAVLT